ncbi:MAG: MarR family transcriptional regulator [Thaumarchaeota archaeon]|nr:MarR family transcriptional regulator [Nitrososphaerota archaeon]
MKIELEKQVMDSLFLAHELHDKHYLRASEISEFANIKQNNLTRILSRLVKRDWIEKTKEYSLLGGEPEGGVLHLMGTDDVKTKSLPREARGLVGFPIEFVKKFEEDLKHAKAKSDHFYNYSRRQEKESVIRKGRIPGRAELWKKILLGGKTKEYTFYRLVQYPFLIHKVQSYPKNTEPKRRKAPKWKIHEGTKRFWKQSAKNLMKELRLTPEYKTPLESLFDELREQESSKNVVKKTITKKNKVRRKKVSSIDVGAI